MILTCKDMQIEEIAARNWAPSQLQTFLLPCAAETWRPPFPFGQATQQPLYSTTRSSSTTIESPSGPSNPSAKHLIDPMKLILRERLLQIH